jgi:hypothetical protein
MRIHLVTFATPRFRHRQLLLGWSALANRVVDSVTHWTPQALLAAGFKSKCPRIELNERGSGFYAWKPFIIQKKLAEAPEGDIVFYCDVGRTFPYKLLKGSLRFFLDWLENHQQSVIPGVKIPWNGPMSKWTKRDAFAAMGMDLPQIHAASPIQASFSFWINNLDSKKIIEEWMNLSAQRQLISDDSSVMGLPELPGFHEHRHDQSLLSLVCLKHGFKGMNLGKEEPMIDVKHPSDVAKFFGDESGKPTIIGEFVAGLAHAIESVEWIARKWLKFNEPSS